TAAGTFSGQPTSNTAPTITITSGANTLTLTPNMTVSVISGTVSGTPTADMTLTNSAGTDTLTLTAGGNQDGACSQPTASTSAVTYKTNIDIATSVANAINRCNSAFPARNTYTATVSSGTVTVTSTSI